MLPAARTPPYTDKRVRRTFSQAYGDDELTWEQCGPDCPATAFVHEDDLTVNLQVELAGDHAVLISCW
jgi:hypothetical protein